MIRELTKESELVEWTGTVEDFLKTISHKNPGYTKKDKGRSIVHWWWEDKEKWFMNHAVQNSSKLDDTNGWYIAKQMPNIIRNRIRDGYKLYTRI